MTSEPSAALPISTHEFRERGHELIDFIADYWERLNADAMGSAGRAVGDGTPPSLPVLSRVKPGEILSKLPASPPANGEAWADVMRDVESIVMPGLTHWQSPNFYAYFPTNGSTPGVLGDLLATGLGVNGLSWASSPAATELEVRMLDWMAEAIGLPDSFRSTSHEGGGGGGAIQGTASESTLIAMLAARKRIGGAWKGSAGGAGTEGGGSAGGGGEGGTPFDSRLAVYTSTQAHSSVLKGAMIAGFAASPEDRRRVRLIDCDASFRMRPDLLAQAMRDDVAAGLVPAYVCATVGTTSSGSVDPVPEIAAIARQHGAWVHVDAAWAGAACVCPEYRHLLNGVELVDSICFNPHKWLLTNFDCDLFWTRDRRAVNAALSITPEYLRNAATDAGAVIDYRDWQIPLGRKFRALKLWFVIRHYGIEGFRRHIREDVALGELFASLLKEDARFELAAPALSPRTLPLVCFRLKPREGGVGGTREKGEETDARNRALLAELNSSGRLHLIHTTLPLPDGEGGKAGVGGRRPSVVLRMAIGGTFTQAAHIRAAWEFIRAAADRVSSS